MIREVLRWPDPRLSQACTPVRDADARGLIADLFDTMYDAPGRGLAAPQIGVMLRAFVMDVTWKDGPRSPLACLDPVVTPVGDATYEMTEACLSIPGIETDVTRPEVVQLTYRDTLGGRHTVTLHGAEARCAQHEIDHLDGLITFDRLDPQARAEAEAAYAP